MRSHRAGKVEKISTQQFVDELNRA
jgi:hypothetical protein